MSAPARPESLAALDRLLEALKSRGVVSEEELAARQASTDRARPWGTAPGRRKASAAPGGYSKAKSR